jgi:hypothetical protein
VPTIRPLRRRRPWTFRRRSSIAAVIEHRGELDLSDQQIRDLEQRDQEREKEDAALRDEAEKRRKQAQDAKANANGGNGAGPAGVRGGGTGGGGMRGGGMRGGGMGGRAPRTGGGNAPPTDREASLEDRMDANDTKAYLDIETVLTDAQREPAREIASDYREKLYERREKARAEAAAAK